ncbi:hypothetical protein MMC26_003489 [Xylographa opegraphella]|nr:hypothetical protein [Xylographa opegraphella]
MNIALSPSSRNVESSLLSYATHSTASSSPSFHFSSVQQSAREASRSLSPHDGSASIDPPGLTVPDAHLDHDIMDSEVSSTSPSLFTHETADIPQRNENIERLDPGIYEEGQNHDRMMIDEPGVEQLPNIGFLPPLGEGPNLSVIPLAPPSSGSSTPVAESFPPASETTVDGNPISTDHERSGTNAAVQLAPDGEDDEDTGDESPYDDDSGFWESFCEDNSSPSEEELYEINRRPKISALNHDHWEDIFFQEVGDPEHTVAATGHILWTVPVFHGTKEDPNRERVMRSPSVNIGGYVWNIKMLPRGDETTDQISVYVECTGPAAADNARKPSIIGENVNLAAANNSSTLPISTDEVVTMSLTDQPRSHVSAETPFHKAADIQTTNDIDNAFPDAPWDVAAQIGCVMYNPNEPRVRVYDKSAHHYDNSSKDWGWVRFHGPWETIHLREHLQRQPLLRNDTIALTAYVRTFDDPTKALWWHQEKQNQWDSLLKAGNRGLFTPGQNGRALVAALSAWLHLKPFQEIVHQALSGSSSAISGARVRPLTLTLASLLERILDTKSTLTVPSSPVSLEILLKTLEWHDWDLDPSCDVIKIWETFQHLLNQEYYDMEGDVLLPNIFREIVTLRQVNYPRISAEIKLSLENPKSLDYGPNNTQDVLDNLLKEPPHGNSSWSRDKGISGLCTYLPSVLQLELPRQKYDAVSRKWTKLAHRIELNDSVTIISSSPTKYILFGIIVHTGKLGSGEWDAIIRPGGPQSRWLQYSGSDHLQRHVRYLTHQEAILSHEGVGHRSVGDIPVAYIAQYVRSDLLQSELNHVHPHHMATNLMREESFLSNDSISRPAIVNIQVFDSKIFTGWSDRGFIDAWAKSNTRCTHHCTLELQKSGDTKIDEVREELISILQYTYCRIWALSATPKESSLSPNRLAPEFIGDGADLRLQDLVDMDGVCRFWIHAQGPPLKDIEGPEPRNGEEPLTVVDNDQSSTSNTTQLVRAHDDAVMGGTQDAEVVSSISEAQLKIQEGTYYFVKRFDVRMQSLTAIGSFIEYDTAQIGAALEQWGFLPANKKFDLYAETQTICREAPISYNSSFANEGLGTGAVIILQDRLPDREVQQISQQGGITTALDYYVYLWRRLNPIFTGTRRSQTYFGEDYKDAEVKFCRFHGQCVHVASTGDAYIGNCVSGTYSGIGTMYYTNGDTYRGEWVDDLPNGQGKMVYAKTGNTYTGGWLNGKRHGKGTMYFEVADEDLETCRICYEAQIDALFYRCGHVVACEECAKQVEVCPICRMPVGAVVKIWKS